MSETVQVAIIGAISALLGGAGMWLIAWKKYPREVRVLKSEETENMAKALNDATAAIINSVNAANKERELWESEKKLLIQRIDELEVHKNERTRMIYEIQRKLEASDREHVAQIAALQTQIETGNGKYESLKKQTAKMYQALRDNNINIDIDPDFRDTLERMKAAQ